MVPQNMCAYALSDDPERSRCWSVIPVLHGSHSLDRLSFMTMTQPGPAGWYPDTEMGGTKYWDGKRFTGDVRPRRRPFAAAAKHKKGAIWVWIIGALILISSPRQLVPVASTDVDSADTTSGGPGSFVFAVVLGVALIVWGFYLIRGQGEATGPVAARARAANDYEAALDAFKKEVDKSKAPSAALVTSFLVLQEAAHRRFAPSDASTELSRECAELEFSIETISTPVLGQVQGLTLHKDWLIVGTRAFGITSTSRAQFHLDDQVQTVTTSQGKGNRVVSTSVEAPRGGVLRIVTDDGQQAINVKPEQVSDARQIVEQVAARADQIKESASIAAQGRASTEAEQIKAISNPDTAKALQNLQNLLFTRVITDEEFAQMKSKLLSNPENQS